MAKEQNKRYSKTRQYDDKVTKKEAKKTSNKNDKVWRNDPHWYAPSEQIAKDLASIPFNVIQGTNWDFPYDTDLGSNDNNLVGTPNVMVIDYTLYNGLAGINSETDGINMAAKQLYTTIRKSNSGAKVYEAPDLMMYILAMREIYALYFYIKRIIGIVNTYTFMNRVFPDGILRSMNWNESDIDEARSNIASYRGRLNILASKINSFAVPKYFKVFMRDAFTASYVFSDAPTLTGQFYIMNLKGTRRWSSTDSVQGSSLVWEPTERSMIDLLDQLDTSLNALFYDTDVNTMAGDIVKAFGTDGLYHVEECPLDYSCVPVYDEDVLNQIQNMAWIPIRDLIQDNSELDVTQQSQNIKSGFKVNLESYRGGNYAATHSKYMINSHKDDPSYMDILEWTRMMNVILDYADDESYVVGGAELYLDVRLFQQCGDYWVEDNIQQDLDVDTNSSEQSTFINKIGNLRSVIRLGAFDWHPFIYLFNLGADEGPGEYGLVSFYGDVKKSTLVSSDTVKRIHDAAIYALFYSQSV